jgi:hypothetical protein
VPGFGGLVLVEGGKPGFLDFGERDGLQYPILFDGDCFKPHLANPAFEPFLAVQWAQGLNPAKPSGESAEMRRGLEGALHAGAGKFQAYLVAKVREFDLDPGNQAFVHGNTVIKGDFPSGQFGIQMVHVKPEGAVPAFLGNLQEHKLIAQQGKLGFELRLEEEKVQNGPKKKKGGRNPPG